MTAKFSIGQIQIDETIKFGNEAKKAQKEMQTVYNQILKIYAGDSIFIKNLKLSQAAWNKYFLSQSKAMFPNYNERHYGSEFSMCTSLYAKKLIDFRIRELRLWLSGREEKDCSSSIMPKDELKEKLQKNN